MRMIQRATEVSLASLAIAISVLPALLDCLTGCTVEFTAAAEISLRGFQDFFSFFFFPATLFTERGMLSS